LQFKNQQGESPYATVRDEDVIPIDLPWGAWYGNGRQRLYFPGHWQVDWLSPGSGSPISREEIAEALNSPIDSPPPRELAESANSACIVVDDLARPTRAGEILEPLLEQLHAGGLDPEAIHIVVASGSHGQLSRDQLSLKVGERIVSQYAVECHDCRSNLSVTGIEYGDRKLRVNRTFFEAELKIAIGSVLPHSFAGYSGGAKLVLPGLADLDATARSHKFVQLGLRGGTDPNRNTFRLEAERIARHLGMNFVVCVLTNVNQETTDVFAGDLVSAHRRASENAEEFFATDVNSEYDCILLNAYPKDIDLIQAENAFVAFKTAQRPVLRDGGVYLLTSAASEGIGVHGLFQPGGASYRVPRPKRGMGQRQLWIYAPKVPVEQVHKLYWDGYPVFHDEQELCTKLAERFPVPIRAAVFPCAPMQQVRDSRAPKASSDG
jgi:lactate racemase